MLARDMWRESHRCVCANLLCGLESRWSDVLGTSEPNLTHFDRELGQTWPNAGPMFVPLSERCFQGGGQQLLPLSGPRFQSSRQVGQICLVCISALGGNFKTYGEVTFRQRWCELPVSAIHGPSKAAGITFARILETYPAKLARILKSQGGGDSNVAAFGYLWPCSADICRSSNCIRSEATFHAKLGNSSNRHSQTMRAGARERTISVYMSECTLSENISDGP